MRTPETARRLAVWVTLLGPAAACGGDGGNGGNGPGQTLVVVPGVLNLADCASQQLAVELRNGDGTPVVGATYIFGSTADSVATVSSIGRVDAQGPGTAIIVIGSAGLIQNVPVTVTAVPPTLAGIPDPLILWPTVQDTLGITLIDCHADPVPGVNIAVTIADPAVASVSGLVVTGQSYGQTTMTTSAGSTAAQTAVSVIGHPATRTVVSTALARTPYGVAVTSSGRVLVTQIGGNTLATGQLPSTALISEAITVGNTPPHVAVNPAGTRAFVTNQSDSSVSVVDLTLNQTVSTVPLAGNGFNLLVSRDGSKVFVTTDNGWTYVLDAATAVKTDSFTVGPVSNGVAEHPTLPLVYFSSRDAGTVTVYNSLTASVVDTFFTGGWPQRMAVSPNGAELYVANETFGVDIWNTVSGQRVTIIPVQAYGLGLSPDGAWIVVASAGSSIHFIDAATRTVLQSLSVGGVTRNVAFEHTGRTAIVTNQADAVHYIR